MSDPQPAPRCTGLTASWCPIHGECVCVRSHEHPDLVSGQRPDMDDPRCPLHSHESDHPRVSDPVDNPREQLVKVLDEFAFAKEDAADAVLAAGWVHSSTVPQYEQIGWCRADRVILDLDAGNLTGPPNSEPVFRLSAGRDER